MMSEEPLVVSFSVSPRLPNDLQFGQVIIAAIDVFKLTDKQTEAMLLYLIERTRTKERP